MTTLEECGCSFIPASIFEEIAAVADAASDDETKELAKLALELMDLEKLEEELDGVIGLLDELAKLERELEADTAKPALNRKIYTVSNKSSALTSDRLLLRDEETAVSPRDPAADKCFENFGHVYKFFSEVFGRNSIDDQGQPLIGLVHYGTNWPNAEWHPKNKLMVFGDGFLKVTADSSKPTPNFAGYFGNFYNSLDLAAHELMHGITVTMLKGPIFNFGETGALIEHVADAFGVMVKQYKLKQTVHDADWLIGQDIILPEVKEMALRSLKDPGNAYKLPGGFGSDKQVAHMRDFKAGTVEDGGGKHIYSGIPNHAFYLAAMQIGGYSWEILGSIWWKTLSATEVKWTRSEGTFKQFARKTIELAQEHGQGVQSAISNAWESVGIL